MSKQNETADRQFSQVHRLIIGDALTILKSLADESVDLCVTSPPYWGLRDYGANCSAIWGGALDCEHEWSSETADFDNLRKGKGANSTVFGNSDVDAIRTGKYQKSDFCSKCGAWKGQLGLEPDFHLYLDHLTEIFGEVKRVLKKTASFYLNIGDTYSGSGQGGQTGYGDYKRERVNGTMEKSVTQKTSLPAKCLIGIPERLMLRLVDEQGWIRRNTLIWYKRNHMPESVEDRRTKSYEPIFHFVKAQKYYYDLDSIRVPHEVCGVTDKRPMNVLRQKLYKGSRYNNSEDPHLAQYQGKFDGAGESAEAFGSPRARTQRNQEEYQGKSLQLDPQDSTRRLLLNVKRKREETGEHDPVFNSKGKNPDDVIDVSPEVRPKSKLGVPSSWGAGDDHPSNNPRFFNEKGKNPGDFLDVTTQPYMEAHFATYPEALILPFIKSSCPKDGIVLDPFGGSGTTAKVARDLGRNSICIEINPDYEELWRRRLGADASLDIEYLVEHLRKEAP